MKQHSIRIGNKDFPLAFTLGTMELLEEQIKDFDLSKIDAIMQTNKGLLDVLYCLAREGAYLTDSELKESRRWFGAHVSLSKGQIVKLITEITETMVDGMSMETDDGQDPDHEVDVVLEEIKKKDAKIG